MSVALWVVVPYVAPTVFLTGHIWRWRVDQFGWTTRTSQLLESRLLRHGRPDHARNRRLCPRAVSDTRGGIGWRWVWWLVSRPERW